MRKILTLLFLLLPSLSRAAYFYEPPISTVNIIDSFQTASTIFSGAAAGVSTTVDVTHIWKGVGSNQFTTNQGLVLFMKVPAVRHNICNDSAIRVTFYVGNKGNTTNNGGFQIYLGTSTIKYIMYDFGFAFRDTNLTYYKGLDTVTGFTHYDIPKYAFTTTGAFDCSKVDTILIGMKAQTGLKDTLTVGEVSSITQRNATGILIVTVDDQWKSWADSGGYRAMDTLGYHYSMFINGGLLGAANKLSLTAIDSMWALYHPDLCNHCWLHDTLTALTTDSITRSIVHNYNFLKGRGYKGYSLFAIPNGTISESRMVDSTLRNCGYINFNRLTQGNSVGEVAPFYNPFAIRAIAGLGSSISLASVETILDNIIAHKLTGIVYGHKLGATAVDVNTWAASDWRLFITYAKVRVDAGTLRIMSLSEYLTYVADALPATDSRCNFMFGSGVGF